MVTFVHLFMPNNFKGSEWTKEIPDQSKESFRTYPVLLINKESSSSKPVVFPVPPPDDLHAASLSAPTPSASTQVQPRPFRACLSQLSLKRSQTLQHTPATDLSSGEFRAIVFRSRGENKKTALDKLESISESLSCDVILI